MDKFLLSRRARTVLLGDRQCAATARSGARCGRSSALGQFVCDKHGAKAPLSLKAGRERLMLLAEPALDALLRALRTAPPCETCGRSDADRDPVVIRAAQIVLDRSGFHPSLAVVQETPRNEFADLDEDELVEKLEEMLRFAYERRAAKRQPLIGVATVIDGDAPDRDDDEQIPDGIRTTEDWTSEGGVDK